MDTLHCKVHKEIKLAEEVGQIPAGELGGGVNSERDDQDTGQHVHDRDGQEEEVMCSVKMVAFLDDVAEDEVADEPDDDDGQVEDDVAPAGSLVRVGSPWSPISVTILVTVAILTPVPIIVAHTPAMENRSTATVAATPRHNAQIVFSSLTQLFSSSAKCNIIDSVL